MYVNSKEILNMRVNVKETPQICVYIRQKIINYLYLFIVIGSKLQVEVTSVLKNSRLRRRYEYNVVTLWICISQFATACHANSHPSPSPPPGRRHTYGNTTSVLKKKDAVIAVPLSPYDCVCVCVRKVKRVDVSLPPLLQWRRQGANKL